MERMHLVEYSDADKSVLKQLANSALQLAAKNHCRLSLGDDYSEKLLLPGASFITLTKKGRLRGCIGSLEAVKPLVEDVAENCYNAALRDPRFESVEASELDDIELAISVLTAPEAINVETEEQLLEEVRPGVDGLIVQDGLHKATYLPSVWEQLPHPREFVAELKIKAGLSRDHWSNSIKWCRYQVLSIK